MEEDWTLNSDLPNSNAVIEQMAQLAQVDPPQMVGHEGACDQCRHGQQEPQEHLHSRNLALDVG